MVEARNPLAGFREDEFRCPSTRDLKCFFLYKLSHRYAEAGGYFHTFIDTKPHAPCACKSWNLAPYLAGRSKNNTLSPYINLNTPEKSQNP